MEMYIGTGAFLLLGLFAYCFVNELGILCTHFVLFLPSFHHGVTLFSLSHRLTAHSIKGSFLYFLQSDLRVPQSPPEYSKRRAEPRTRRSP